MTNEEIYNKYMGILYPNFSEMSPKRKDEAEMRSWGIIGYFSKINAIFPLIKEEYPDFKDRDLVNIAKIYAEMCEKASTIEERTGRVLRGENDMPVYDYKTRQTTSQEQINLIKMAVAEYDENKGKIGPRIQNFLTGVKNYNITLETAQRVLGILNQELMHKDYENEKTDQGMDR